MGEDNPRYGEADQALHAALGAMVVEWNRADGQMRAMLANLVAGGPTIEALTLANILTLELGSRGLETVLVGLVSDVLEDDLADVVFHAAVFHERLRAYRNHYVHGATAAMLFEIDGKPVVHVQASSTSAKAGVVSKRAVDPIDKIEQVTDWCVSLRDFAAGITHTLNPFKPDEELPPLPSKPPLPSVLELPGQAWRETLQRPKRPRPK